MSLVIPDDILDSARLSADELRLEVALLLFQRGGLTLARASRFGGVSRLKFQRELAARQVPVHYGVDDFESDVEALERLEQP